MTRVYAAIALALLLLCGVWYYGHTRYVAGASGVQARWDDAKATQATAAVTASETARVTELQHANDFAGIAAGYLQAQSHAYPSIADALPAAVAGGAVQLRDTCPETHSGGVPEAAARSRAADAAATQALADRVQAAIAAVRAGDEADARERLLGAQVTALQAVLTAERKSH